MAIKTTPNTAHIIMPNWNGFTDTKEAIESLEKSEYSDFLLHLLDNNSNPEDVKLLKKHYAKNPRIKLYFSETNLGFTKGNNYIYKELLASYPEVEFVILLNNDVSVTKYFVGALVEAFRAGGEVVSSKMIDYQDKTLIDNTGHIMLRSGEIIPRGTLEEVCNHRPSLENMGACAGACLYSVKMLEEMGGMFDEFFVTGYEDAEIGVRAKILGYNCVYAPEAILFHKGSVSINKVRDEKYSTKIQIDIYYTIFKLLPFWNLVLAIFAQTLRLSAIFVVFTLWRPKIVRVNLRALKYLLAERATFQKARKDFQELKKKQKNTRKPISGYNLLTSQSSFIANYLKYFYRFVVLGRKSVFER